MRPTANESRYAGRVSHADWDSDSDDESDAAQFISREADESEGESDSSDGDDDDESGSSDDGDETSSTPGVKSKPKPNRHPRGSPGGRSISVESESSGENSSTNSKDDDSDDSEDDSDDDDLPPMQLFSSQPVHPTARPASQTPIPLPSTAMPRLGARLKETAVKKAESDSDSSSDSDSGSGSDSELEAPAFPSLSQEDVKQEPGVDDVEAASATESSSSDNSSDRSSEDEAGSSAAVEAAVDAEEDTPSDQNVGVDVDGDMDVDSSDDGLDEIPSILPPGTQADVLATTDEESPEETEQPSKETSEAPETLEAPVTYAADPRASPYDIDGLPATPIPPPKRAAQHSAVAPSSQDMPSSSQPLAQKQRGAKKQKAKVPFVEKAAADEETPDATSEEPEPAEAAGVAGAAKVVAEPTEVEAQEAQETQEATLEESSTSAKKRKRDPVEEALEENDDPESPAQTTAKTTKRRAQMTPGGASGASNSKPSTAKKAPAPTTKSPKTPKPRASNGGGASTAGSLKKGPQGNFTPKEVDEMKRAAQQYMEDNDMRLGDFNVMVHDNAMRHRDFWKTMAADFPDHKRLQVILRCRRVFHNFSHTYNWTPEHDVELADHVSKHGNKWQLIGGLMNRSAEDVRKRWDEHVVCGDKVHMSYWRFEEEKKLGHVVGEVLREMQQSHGHNTTLPEEDAINDLPWQVISERMGFTRTARQCRIKWRVIHQSYHFNADGALVGPPEPEQWTQSQAKAEKLKDVVWSTVQSPAAAMLAKAPRSVQSLLARRSESATPKSKAKPEPTSKASPKSKSKPKPKSAVKGDEFRKSTVIPLLGMTPYENGRTVPETDRPINDKTRQQVRTMTAGDKHTLLLSIRDSNVGREDMIPWPRITDASFRKNYNRAARELVWSRLKRTVPNYHRKSVRQICDHLIAAYDADQNVWDAELDDVDGDDVINGKGKGKGKAASWTSNGSKGKTAKSNVYVAESDSDAVDDDMEEDEDEDEDERPTLRPRAARSKVNGYAEKQVPESEDESNESNDEEEDEEEDQDSSDADAEAEADARSRSTREPSVDLSAGDNLAAEGPVASIEGVGEGEEAEHEHRLTDDMFPLTLSLSPGIAKHKPTALARMRNINNPNGQMPNLSSPAASSASISMAKRFGTTNSKNPNTPTPRAKQRNSNGEVRRTKKRPLGSAQWHPDVDSDGDHAIGVYDDIEDVSDDARRSQSIRGRGDVGRDGPRSAKRMRAY